MSTSLQSKIASSLHAHWRMFFIEGLVLLVLGVIAVIVPQLATFAVALTIGWLILLSGIVGLIATWMMRSAPGFGWGLLSAVLAVLAGILLLRWPVGGALSLTLILTAFLCIEGVLSILYALDHRRESSGRWSMMLVSGLIDLGLAAMIFLGLPATAAWAIGLLVGVNLIFGGSAVIAMAWHARASAPAP
jgi:uncharacterized membrane protein HdeD (DUF308 family)